MKKGTRVIVRSAWANLNGRTGTVVEVHTEDGIAEVEFDEPFMDELGNTTHTKEFRPLYELVEIS